MYMHITAISHSLENGQMSEKSNDSKVGLIQLMTYPTIYVKPPQILNISLPLPLRKCHMEVFPGRKIVDYFPLIYMPKHEKHFVHAVAYISDVLINSNNCTKFEFDQI